MTDPCMVVDQNDEQFLIWHKRNLSEDEFLEQVRKLEGVLRVNEIIP